MNNLKTYKLENVLEALIDYRGKSPPKSESGIPVLSAKVVKTDGLVEPIEQTIAEDYYSEWMTRGLPEVGDVIFTTEGPMGEVIQLNETTVKFALGQRIVCLRGNPKLIDNTYLRYLLISPEQQSIMSSYATGTTVMGVSQKALRSVPVEIPDIEYQKSVASILIDYDNKIELNRRMNETLEAMAQAIFKDWFVDFGPVFRKLNGETDPVKILGGLISDPERAASIAALFPDSFGDNSLPEGWNEGKLSDLALEVRAKAKPEDINSSTPYIGLEHMPRGSIALDSWETAAKVTSAKSIFEKNQILFGKLRPYFHKVGIAPISGICSTDIVVVEAVKTFDRALVCSICSSKEFVEYNTQASSGTRMPRTKWKVMGDYPIAFGREEVRRAFSELVSPMHEKIHQSILENQSLAETRDYLLPKLMSGEVRVGTKDDITIQEKTPTETIQNVDLFGDEIVSEDVLFERNVILAALIISALQEGDTVVGNTRLQKAYYLFYRFMGWSMIIFVRHHYGPYCAELADDIQPEAVSRDYISNRRKRKFPGSVPSSKIDEAHRMGQSLNLSEGIDWLRTHFCGMSRDDMESLVTIDDALRDLQRKQQVGTPKAILDIIANEPKWADKIERLKLTERSVANYMRQLEQLLGDR